MRKHRMLLAASVLSIATLAIGPVAQAREVEPGDDRRGRHEVQLQDDRGMDDVLLARQGSDDPAGDDRGRVGHGSDDPTPHF
jgi:hypothetical protein